jgi:hypothetical protein
VTPVDAILAKPALSFVTLLIVAVLLFSAIILALGLHVNLELGPAAPSHYWWGSEWAR